jgi:hypothetical protein
MIACMVACMVVLVLLTLINVVIRYFTDESFAATEEVSISLMVVMTVAGACAAAARDRHIRIEYFYETGSAARRKRLALLSAAAGGTPTAGGNGRAVGLLVLLPIGLLYGETRWLLQPPYPGHWATEAHRASWVRSAHPWLMRDLDEAMPVWVIGWRAGDASAMVAPEGPVVAEEDGFDLYGGRFPACVRLGNAEWHGTITFERVIQFDQETRSASGSRHTTGYGGTLKGPAGPLQLQPVMFCDQDRGANLGRRRSLP